MRIRFVALCLVAFTSSGLLPAAARAEAAGGHLSGVVRDETGKVVNGGEASLTDATGTVAEDITDSSGRYSLRVAPGTYDLGITGGSQSRRWIAQVRAVEVGTSTTLDLVVVRPEGPVAPEALVTFRGTLRDGEGRGVVGYVQLQGPRSTATVTAPDGSFALTTTPGRYTLAVNRHIAGASVITQTAGLDLQSDRTQDLTIPNPDLTTVTVHDEAGASLDGSSVDLHGGCEACSLGFELFPGAVTTGHWSSATVTDANGVARLRSYPGSDVTLTARPNNRAGLVPTTRTVTLPSPDPLDVVLERDTWRWVTWQARLRYPDGRPYRGEMELVGADPVRSGGGDGWFSLSVPAGHYALELEDDLGTYSAGYKSGDNDVPGMFITIPDFELTADRTDDITIPLDSLAVQTLDRAGRPVSVDIEAESSGPIELFPGAMGTGLLKTNTASTDVNGMATLKIFRGLPPEMVSAKGIDTYEPLATATVPPGATSVVLRLDGPVLQGTLRDARGDVLADEPWVSFTGGTPPGQFAPWGYGVGPDGAYRLEAMSGDYTLYASNEEEPDRGRYTPAATATLPAHWSFAAPYHHIADATVDLTIPDAAPADILVVGQDGLPFDATMRYYGSTTGEVDLAPGLPATAWSYDEIDADSGRLRPLLFGPSKITGYIHRFNFEKMAMAPGDQLVVAIAERVANTPPGSPVRVGVYDAPGGSARLAWSPPEDDGGGPLTSYVVTATQDGHTVSRTEVPATENEATVSGLSTGKPYRFSVAAANAKGTGPTHELGYDYWLPAAVPTAPGVTTTTSTTTTTPTTTVLDGPRTRSGYWMVGSDGKVYPFGDARHLGDPVSELGSAEAVDLEPSGSGNGYWVLDERGRVFAYGDAADLGDADLDKGEHATSLSATGKGYWVFTSTGRVLAYGDAKHYGDMAGTRLNGAVLDSVVTPSGNGYYMVASDGGVFTFGDARFSGSMGDRKLNAPVQSLVPDGDGDGYWLVASDGGIFAFDAPFRGSMGGTGLNRPVTGMVRFGNGYLMVGEDGGIFNFSDREFHGALGDRPPVKSVVAVAALS